MRSVKIVIGLTVFLLCVYIGWRIVVNRQIGGDLIAAGRTATEFMIAIQTGDFDQAYALTSFSYSQRVGRKGLEDLPRKYPALKNAADPGAVGLESRRLERFTVRHFMVPKVPAPKNQHDYMPVMVKMTVGNTGEWRVTDVVICD